MFYIISFRSGNKNKAIKINEEQAKRVREIMATGNQDSIVTIGLETMRVNQIKNLSAETADISKQAIKDMRRRMMQASESCTICSGEGFLDVYFKDDKESKNYESLCETRKRMCNCIGVVKQQAGIDRNDFSWHFKDEEERESAYSR
jgi:hypothetical protein